MNADPLDDPISRLRAWYREAEEATPNADVVALATASIDAIPSVRMVNFRGWQEGCLSFYTNYESRKGAELSGNPRATMLFYWSALGRQIRVEGTCKRMDVPASQTYFASRHRESQLSTLMSRQSAELQSFDWMERCVAELREEYAGRDIPCPPYWGGMLLEPARIEFHIARRHRRHYRWEYWRDIDKWKMRRLHP